MKLPRVAGILGFAALLPWAAACATTLQPSQERVAAMKPSDIPYRVQARVWRDEQPGDDPTLHVSVRLDPRQDAAPWPGLAVSTVRLAVGQTGWRPDQSSLEPLADGAFELRAQGPPTLDAGAEAVLTLTFNTAQGPKTIEISGLKIALID